MQHTEQGILERTNEDLLKTLEQCYQALWVYTDVEIYGSEQPKARYAAIQAICRATAEDFVTAVTRLAKEREKQNVPEQHINESV